MAKTKKSAFAQYTQQQEASWEGDGFESLPDLEGLFVLDRGEVKESGAGNWGISLGWKLTQNLDEEGENVGRLQFEWLAFEGKNGWNPFRVKAFFDDIGMELPEFDEIEAALETIIEDGLAVQATLETTGEYQNFKITAVIDADSAGAVDEDEDEEAGEVPSEDEIDEMDKEEILEAASDLDVKLKGRTLKALKTEFKKACAELVEEEADEEDEEDEEEVDPLVAGLVTVATTAGIEDVDEDMDIDEIKEVLEEYEFDFDDLSEEEVASLVDAGLSELIVGMPKKKAAAKKKVAKKKKAKK